MGKDLQPVGRLIALCAVLMALCAPAQGIAQPANDRYRALTHFRQGEAYMKAEAYAEAAKEYQAAYEAVPKPGFLFNIGLAHESAGDKKKAVDHYRRYLSLEPNGRASEEARARAAKLEGEIMTEQEAAAEAQRRKEEAERKRQVAESHANSAQMHLEAKQYDKAIAALRAAYEEDVNPHYVYRLAEVYRLKGDRPRAIIEYDLYRELAPEGPQSAEALRKRALLQRELDEIAKAPPPKPPPASSAPPPPPPPLPVEEEEEDDGIGWWWFGIGAAVIAAGIVVDLAPSSARNGELDAVDFLPLTFYGAGGTSMLISFF